MPFRALFARHRSLAFVGAALAFSTACGGSTTEESTDAGTDTALPAMDAGTDAARDVETPDANAPDTSVDAGVDTGVDAGTNPYAGGTPIVAPPNTWTYVPMNDFICGNGSTSGISVNPSSDPNAPLLVFFMGGGACWDAATCLSGTASNITNDVGAAENAQDIPRVAELFNRIPANPFANAHQVFIPYCTADIHAGDSIQTYKFLLKSVTVHHRGAKNTEAVVKRLMATYPTTPKVYVTGASGGGYGTLMNTYRFQTAFPNRRIDVLNDSGTPIQPAGSLWRDMQNSWNIVLPPGCTGCATDTSKLVPHLAATMGNSRFALLSYTEDQTIRSFTGTLIASDFKNKLLAIRDGMAPTQKAFLVDGNSHVLLKQNPLPTAASGMSLPTWLTQFATDDPAWAHQGP